MGGLETQNKVPAHIREQLKAPGKEFALEGDRILPLHYSPETYAASADEWTFENLHPDQPLRVTVEAMPALARFADTANVVLVDPSRPLNLNTTGAGPLGEKSRQTDGLNFELKPVGGDFAVSAVNRGQNPSGWGCAEIILDGGPKDLSRNRALGAWVQADGSGALLHFVVEDSGRWNVRDYYVRLDFKGRRYIEIPESAKGEVYDFAFPYSNYWAIRNINFQAIARLYVFLTGVPPGRTAEARFSRLEALRETPLPIENPQLSVNGAIVTFPVRLEADGYLELGGDGKTRVFDPNGFTKAEVAPGGLSPRHGTVPTGSRFSIGARPRRSPSARAESRSSSPSKTASSTFQGDGVPIIGATPRWSRCDGYAEVLPRRYGSTGARAATAYDLRRDGAVDTLAHLGRRHAVAAATLLLAGHGGNVNVQVDAVRPRQLDLERKRLSNPSVHAAVSMIEWESERTRTGCTSQAPPEPCRSRAVGGRV